MNKTRVKTKSFIKAVSLVFLCIFCLCAVNSSSAYANSAQNWWQGTDASGVAVSNPDCPITVKSELLTFDINEFPQNYYESANEFDTYGAKVTARYEFFNPASYTVDMSLVFPFGTLPSYCAYGQSDLDNFKKYSVKTDGQETEVKLRHSFAGYSQSFDFDLFAAQITDNYKEDEFFRCDMPVTVYTFSIPKSENNLSVTAVTEFDPDCTTVFSDFYSGFKATLKGAEISASIGNAKTFLLYVVGEDVEKVPVIFNRKNGIPDKTPNGNIKLTEVTQQTFLETVLSFRAEDSSVSEIDWYNAAIDRLRAENVYYASDIYSLKADMSSLMQYYQYSITVLPGQTVINEVAAPMYPNIDGSYEPDAYRYCYLLSPAAKWSEFDNIEIRINTPYYITDSSVPFAKTEVGYSYSQKGLPQGELNFSLCSVENPVKAYGGGYVVAIVLLAVLTYGGAIFLLVAAIGGLIALITIKCIKRGKKRSGE